LVGDFDPAGSDRMACPFRVEPVSIAGSTWEAWKEWRAFRELVTIVPQ
jgi:hypothetical protein